jgi:MoaA/NifB/PqqE/SkfB family radical SAM enzyme
MRIKSIKFNDGFDCYIKWRMTDICNYACPYCVRSKTTESYSEETITKENADLVQVAKDVNTLLENSDFTNVKIDLIGGEVTLLDLGTILAEITTAKVTMFDITTNFSKSAEYYINLAKLFPISLTASLHSDCADKDVFFEKVKTVYDANVLKYFKCETVSCSDNQSEVEDFISRCEEIGVDYIIDRDKTNSISQSEIIKTKRTGTENLYSVEYTDGTKTDFASKGEIFNTLINNVYCKGRYIHTKGMMCTNSYNYIYLDKDTVLGRQEGESGCKHKIKISDFKFLPPAKCDIDFCSFCGRFSVYTADGETLEENSFDTISENTGEEDCEEDTAITE